MSNREHLFRGKRKDNGEWVVSKSIIQIDYSEIYLLDEPRWIEVIPQTVDKYVNLDTLETSTHICEDDIIRYDNGAVCFIGQVVNLGGAWGIFTKDPIPLKRSSLYNNFISFWEIMCHLKGHFILDNIVPDVEVIGNVHDNSELLEVAK